jgi:3-phenylpropionate/cinnamic acid dioxygenase small subunit
MSDIDALLAKQQITEICYRYGINLDNREWSKLRECFTEDAVADYLDMPSCQGYQAIEDTCREALSPLTGSQHLISNVVVTLDGDEADSVCYLQAQHVKSGTPGGDTFIIAGRYLDRLVRAPEGWRIKHRRLEGIWTDGNPAVVGG